jgi:hypothetical protein
MVSYPPNELLLRLMLAEAGSEKTQGGDDLVGMTTVGFSKSLSLIMTGFFPIRSCK